MTREEFNKTRFSAGTVICHTPTNKTFFVISVDFDEQLIGVDEDEFFDNVPDDNEVSGIRWLRCENCEIINEEEDEQALSNHD